MNRQSGIHVDGESGGCVVPTKCPNKGESSPAEDTEGRRPAKESREQASAPRTLELSDLRGVRGVASKDKRTRFTALLHHVTVPLLQENVYALKREAVPGVDGMTWEQYEMNLDGKLMDLHSRSYRGTYRAEASRSACTPRADGRQRPLGIAVSEDKIVQRAVVPVLNPIYAEDFKGFSYGFRPGRNPHQALDALGVGIMRKKVAGILDAYVRGFFSSLSHEWMVKSIEYRIANRRIVRLIRKWLRAGVSEEGKWSKSNQGTPRGSDVFPFLANIYLHYAFDLWVRHCRRHNATCDAIEVPFADDIVERFENRVDAERFLQEWKDRVQKFGLELHPDKTRVIEFGRQATEPRKQRGEGKPEVFDFPGLTHMCGKTRKTGRFIVKRKTIRKRLSAKLTELKEEFRRRRRRPTAQVGKWLRSAVQGYFNDHAVPGNMDSLNSFRAQVISRWYCAIIR